jgi:hypothetical protein
MNKKEILELKKQRIAELQQTIEKSTQQCQQVMANHNAWLGRLAEAQMHLEELNAEEAVELEPE